MSEPEYKKEEKTEKTASLWLTYISLIIGAIYIVPMLIMYLCYTLHMPEETVSAVIGSIETVLFLDFYIVTLPALLLCIVTAVYNSYNLERFAVSRIKALVLTVITILLGVLIGFLAVFFMKSAW